MGIQVQDAETGEWRKMTREEFDAIPVENDGCLGIFGAVVFVVLGFAAAIIGALPA